MSCDQLSGNRKRSLFGKMILAFIYISKVAIAMGLKFSSFSQHKQSIGPTIRNSNLKKKFKQDSSLTEPGDVDFCPKKIGNCPPSLDNLRSRRISPFFFRPFLSSACCVAYSPEGNLGRGLPPSPSNRDPKIVHFTVLLQARDLNS